MSDGAANTSILYAVKKDPEKAPQVQGAIFFARAEYIGVSPSGRPIDQNDLIAIREHYRQFEEGNWKGIELRSTDENEAEIVRYQPSDEDGLWLEPEVNRTSLLYDRLSYILKSPKIEDRFSYTYFHPRYYEIIESLSELATDIVSLESLCVKGYPRRGKKPSEDSTDGIPVLKVRNITGQGIDFDADYTPDSEEIRQECARALIKQNDILITSTGEGTIGRIDVYLPEDDAFVDSHITICRLRPNVNLDYVVEFLRSEYGQIQMLRNVSGSTGQTELLLDHVKTIQIPLPQADVQKAIVERMKQARAIHDELQIQVRALREKSANVIAQGRQEMIDLLNNPEGKEMSQKPKSEEKDLTRDEFMEVLTKVSKPKSTDGKK